MRKHLSCKHPSVLLADSKTSLKPLKQTSLVLGGKKLATSQQESITRKVAMMCALDIKPVSVVEGLGFKLLVHSLNPGYRVPCRKTVSKYLEHIYKEHKDSLIESISEKPISLTSDLWTSASDQGYITVTAHYLDNWEIQNKVLATRNMTARHTGLNIGQELNNICAEFRVAKKVALVTDNAANMSIAAQECGAPHINCFSHTLQLAIEDGLKLDQVSKVIGASRRLVSHFSHSSLAVNALLEKQIGSKLKLIQDVPTRWNSSFMMMERLLKLRVAAYGVMFDDQVTKPADRQRLEMKESYWTVMEDIVPILGPLAEITDMLGKEDIPTGSSVFVVLYNIINGPLLPSTSDSTIAKSLKQKIKLGLQKRFAIGDEGKPVIDDVTSPLLYACLLDPRYKNILADVLMSEADIALIQGAMLQEMELLDGEVSTKTEVQESSFTSDPKYDWKNDTKVMSWKNILQGRAVDVGLTQNSAVSNAEELNDYMKDVMRGTNPLDWWRLNATKYPRLSELAKIYLTIPATSIPSERTFSVAGLTVSKLRSSLDPESVDHIIFVNKNLKADMKKKWEGMLSQSFSSRLEFRNDGGEIREPFEPMDLSLDADNHATEDEPEQLMAIKKETN